VPAPPAGRRADPVRPGRQAQRFLYGHVWVTLAWVVTHPLWGVIGLPLRALLYVRKQDVPRVPARQGWAFRTKLELAADLLTWAVGWVLGTGRAVRAVVDGFYAVSPRKTPLHRTLTVLVHQRELLQGPAVARPVVQEVPRPDVVLVLRRPAHTAVGAAA
jgi:hypothetical protein